MCLKCRDFANCEIATFQLNNMMHVHTLFGNKLDSAADLETNMTHLLTHWMKCRKFFEIATFQTHSVSHALYCNVCVQIECQHMSHFCLVEMSRFRKLRNRDIADTFNFTCTRLQSMCPNRVSAGEACFFPSPQA